MTIRRIGLNSSGIYTCEASSEAPFFKTISESGEMTVLDLPDTKPILKGGKPRGHKVGEWMNLNCTSPNSKPPAKLKWYINNEIVSVVNAMRNIFVTEIGICCSTADMKLIHGFFFSFTQLFQIISFHNEFLCIGQVDIERF